jgi:integrase
MAFHKFMEESFGIPTIDVHDLDIPESIAELMVDPNYISTNEYSSILSALSNDEAVSSEQKIYQACAFCLGANFGFRSAELFTLLIGDIEFNNGSGTITIQPNRFATLKTQSSFRNLPITVWLDSLDLNIIKSAFNHRINQGAQKNHPLFGHYSKNELMDILAIKSRVINVMRHITGDMRLKFHHLRHTFANWMRLGLNNDPVLDWQVDLRIKKMREHFDFSNSRRGLFQLAEFLGHGHPSTTIVNYIHNIDQLLAYHIDLRNKDLDVKTQVLSEITGVKGAAIRKKKSRGGNLSVVEVLRRSLLSNIDGIDFKEYLADKNNELLPAQELQSFEGLTIEKLNWLILRFPYLQDSQQIAQHLFCNLEDVNNLISGFKRIGEKSGYVPETLLKLFPKKPNHLQKYPRQDLDQTWIDKLEHVAVKNRPSIVVIEMLELWEDYVIPSETTWQFETKNQLEAFIVGLMATELQKSKLKIIVEPENKNVLGLSIDDINQTEAPPSFKFKKARPHAGFNHSPIQAQLMAVTSRGSSQVRNVNYYLFIVCALEFAKRIEKHQLPESL